VLAFSVALAACAAISPARGILVFSFLFPCAGLLARTCGGADPVMWPGVLLAGLSLVVRAEPMRRRRAAAVPPIP